MRDEVGKMRGAGCWLVEGTYELKNIELLAILRGLQLVSGMGTRNITLESDDDPTVHNHREFNNSAHLLARFTWQLDSQIVWENTPKFVDQAL